MAGVLGSTRMSWKRCSGWRNLECCAKPDATATQSCISGRQWMDALMDGCYVVLFTITGHCKVVEYGVPCNRIYIFYHILAYSKFIVDFCFNMTLHPCKKASSIKKCFSRFAMEKLDLLTVNLIFGVNWNTGPPIISTGPNNSSVPWPSYGHEWCLEKERKSIGYFVVFLSFSKDEIDAKWCMYECFQFTLKCHDPPDNHCTVWHLKLISCNLPHCGTMFIRHILNSVTIHEPVRSL